MTEEKNADWVAGFLDRLGGLSVGDRTALKRSLGISLREADARAVAAFFKVFWGGSRWEEDICFITACAVAAFHNVGGEKKSFQLRLREMAVSSEGVENKLLQLLDIPRKPETYFAVKIGRLLRQMLAAGLNLDFAKLLKDLQQWDHPARFVQLKWARDFYLTDSGQPDAENDSKNNKDIMKEKEENVD